MELTPSLCRCDNGSKYIESCCFNPVILFVCNLCRGAFFESVEKLLLHKRQEHTVEDLKRIKFIVFQERFVETEAKLNTFRNELTSSRCTILGNSSDINSLAAPGELHHDDSLAPLLGIDNDNCIDTSNESNEFDLPNPFIHLLRLTSKQITSYSRPTAGINQNQFQFVAATSTLVIPGRELTRQKSDAEQEELNLNEALDWEGDQDYDSPDVISSSSDSEFQERQRTPKLNASQNNSITRTATGIIPNDAAGFQLRLRGTKRNRHKNIALGRKTARKTQRNPRLRPPTFTKETETEIGTPKNYENCPLSLKDWITKEKETNPENIILLDPDPVPDLFQAKTDTNKEVDDTYISTATATALFVVTPETPINCKLCSTQLTSDPIAKHHLKTCWTKNKTKHVHCPLCSRSYSSSGALNKHNKVKHLKPGEATLSFKCTLCSKELTTQTGFNYHMEIHQNPNLRPFVCEICGSGFRKMFKLKQHKLSHTEERPFQCQLCPVAFKNKELLRHHQAVHVEDRNFHCLPCNKSFKSKNSLQMHTRFHLEEKWYPCKADNCQLKFPTRSTLFRHCKNDHAELFSQIAKLSCTVCMEKFMFPVQLERHMLSHGGEKPFKCSEEGCSGAYTSKQSLKEHVRKHTGERPYQCDQCGSTFARSGLFIVHVRAHNNPKDGVLCHLCPRTFSSKSELRKHLKSHEKGEGEQFRCSKCNLKFMSKRNLKDHMKTHYEHREYDTDGMCSSSSDGEVEKVDAFY